MKVYLASRYSRREELRGYREELIAAGIDVTSRWLIEDHEWVGTPDEVLPVDVGRRLGEEDLADIRAADLVVAFTEPPRSTPSRGGRHVELGYALALRIPILLVGPRENVFCCLVTSQVDTWRQARFLLRSTY